jgi:hypothetical protein
VIGEQLIFYGLAWPTAKVVSVVEPGPRWASDRDRLRQNLEKLSDSAPSTFCTALEKLSAADFYKQPRHWGHAHMRRKDWPSGLPFCTSRTRDWLLAAPSGVSKGRVWQADAASAIWRDFAALDLSDADSVVSFVRRRGDPEGLLNRPGASADSGRWRTPLHDGLGYFAACWTDADERGVSRCSRDSRDATAWWRLLLFPAIAPQIEVIPAADGGTGLAMRARTLGAFMALSAASALERRIQMRRCRYCESWFELRRKDMQFCSATCRAALANKQKGES